MQKYLHLHIKSLQSILSDFTKKFAKFSTTIFIKKIVTLKLSEKILKFTLVFFLLLLFAQYFNILLSLGVFLECVNFLNIFVIKDYLEIFQSFQVL